jgi:FAD:protein FMN transferase
VSLSSYPFVGPVASSARRHHGIADSARELLRRWARRSRVARYAFHYEQVLGTSLELQVVAAHADVARRVESALLAEVDRLARILSGYSRESELSRWQATQGVPVAVSPELTDVLESSETWRARTRGAFNPAVVSLVELLRDATPHGDGDATSDDANRLRAVHERLRELSETPWSVDRACGTACRLTPLPVSLDAIAKGYIVERISALASATDGVTQVLVNIGGDLRHHGARSVAVGVADPRASAENAEPIAVVSVRDEALATSGGYRRGFVANGRRVSHIIDPRTGRPAERIASASVIARDCTTADALSTAFSVMEPHESVALADTLPDVGCLLVESDGTITTNAAWDARAASPRHDTTHSRN